MFRVINVFFGISLLFPVWCSASVYVEYTGDVLPEANNPPFTYVPASLDDSPSVGGGILTFPNTRSTGSHDYYRQEAMYVEDLVVQQFRVRLIDPVESSNSIYRGARTQLEFGDDANPGLGIMVFVLKDEVRLRQLDRGNIHNSFWVQESVALDTTVFHTYTVVKHSTDTIRLYIDGRLAIDQPIRSVAGTWRYGGEQRFSVNPSATTEWDFFRYAIGDDALDRLPVPEPTTLSTMLLIFAATGRAFVGPRCS
jgi:hypothetical protein